MENTKWINENTSIQVLLDAEAEISNVIYTYKITGPSADRLTDTRKLLHRQIECLRGPAPSCYGQDDCSTSTLSTCPWRMTCGS